MFALEITGPGGFARRFFTAERTITLGSAPTCDVELPGAAPVHVHLTLDPRTGYYISDATQRGIEVEHQREVREWRSARVPSTIRLAGYRIRCIDVTPPRFEASYGAIAPEESALVDAIVTGDAASRLVYADWLEERGDLNRAAIVRGLVEGDRPDGAMLERLVHTNVRWRARVLEPPIEACPRGEACVGHWGLLERSGRADMRRCGSCTKLVLYCVDAAQAREHVDVGGTVVFDPFVPRWPRDLTSG